MFFCLKIFYKDKKLSKKFLKSFKKIKLSFTFTKIVLNFKKRNIITVLKSPHVNKTAQEQFEYRLYSLNLFIYFFKPSIILFFLKTLNFLCFLAFNINLISFFCKRKIYSSSKQIIRPDNIRIKTNNILNKINLKKEWNLFINSYYIYNFILNNKYIQFFDIYGEVCLKEIFCAYKSNNNYTYIF